MAKSDRLDLIRQIQGKRNSIVLTYVTGDRPNLTFQIGGETPRLFYDHLQPLKEKAERLDLFLYSVGGDTSVPWRIVSLLREFSKEFNVLVPFRAYSAATLLSLGADKIIMTRKGELGPIEPSVANEFNPIDPISKTQRLPINVEDVFSYISFVKEKTGIVHQPEIGDAVGALSSQVHPLSIGNVNRQASYIRMISGKLLKSHISPPSDAKIEETSKNLVEKIYFHGHGISRAEARELGLNVEDADPQLEELMWKLYLEYEASLNLGVLFNPEDELDSRSTDQFLLNDIDGAFIESESFSHVFRGNVKMLARRQTPQTLNLSINLQVPPPNQLNQQQIQALQQAVQQIVMQQITAQSPIIGYDAHLAKARWLREPW